jgi:selenocysteine lyase/cysteine desulfurase
MWDAELEPVVNAAIKDGLIHFEQNLAREIHEQVTRSMQELLKKAVDTVIKENYNLRYAIEKRIEQQAREVVAELLAKPKN